MRKKKKKNQPDQRYKTEHRFCAKHGFSLTGKG